MSALITGSFAYDTIMVFRDQFKNHILAEQMHILNVCFLVPEMRKEFGGCSGNIAYNLHLLGGDPIPMATVGMDFAPYRKWLNDIGINHSHVKEIPGTYTAQAFMTTDTDNNQITAFHPGAMNHAHENKIGDAHNIDIGIVAPDGRDAMIEHARQFVDANIPFFFDPGQGLQMFAGDELNRFITQSNYIVVNDYESAMLVNKTGKELAQIAEQVDVLIVTRGGNGCDIFVAGSQIHIAAIAVSASKDPTGCGDAFRAGLLYGVVNQWDWQSAGQLASVMGGIKIEQIGTQNHCPDKSDIESRYKENFATTISL